MQNNAQESKNLYHQNPVTQKPNNIMMDGRKETLSTESFKQKQLIDIKRDMADTQIIKKKASKLVSWGNKDETRHKSLTTRQNRDQSIEMPFQWNTSLKHLGASSLEGMVNEVDK